MEDQRAPRNKKGQIHGRYNGLFYGLAQLGLGNFLHLGEDHSGYFLGGEGFFLAEVGDLDEGRSVLVNDLEGPVSHVLDCIVRNQGGAAQGVMEDEPF